MKHCLTLRMRQLTIALALLTLCQNTKYSNAEDNCLINDVPVGLMARLFYDSDKSPMMDINCSAIIIHPNWLLSPASCLFDHTNQDRYKVEVSPSIYPSKLVVKKIKRNLSFNNELGAGYDLALIYVELKMAPGDNCTVHLPTSSTQPNFNERSCKLVKFAKDTKKTTNVQVNDITVHLTNQQTCKYIKQVQDPKLVDCAGSVGVGVCPDQSGAVILCKSIDTSQPGYYLRDMSSWGDILCESSDAYLFTKIVNYIGWIKRTIDPSHST